MEQILRLNNYLKQRFGCKVYKIALNAGLTCPNRDGRIGFGGCIFCSGGGSGDFASSPELSISEQITYAISKVRNKISDGKYIAYFQAYTNTYAPACYLSKIFYEAINHPDVVALSIATRPDCLPDDVMELLKELSNVKPVFVELGFQTSNEETARLIRRGYDNVVFDNAVYKLHEIGVMVVVHTIIGLPYETGDDIIETIRYINRLPVNGIKLQLLHVLKGTDLEDFYYRYPDAFLFMETDDYVNILGRCISNLRDDIVIHRLTGDGPKALLVAPMWSADKKTVLNKINQYLSKNCIIQGKEIRQNGT